MKRPWFTLGRGSLNEKVTVWKQAIQELRAIMPTLQTGAAVKTH
jgi:hypothetical protein